MVVIGGALAVTSGGGPFLPTGQAEGSLTQLWVSETARDVTANHHPAIGATIGGTPLVFAPVSGAPNHHGSTDGTSTPHHDHARCALFGIDGRDGEVRWEYPIPEANCTIHSVADPTLADVGGDGTVELLATTTERSLAVIDPGSGTVIRRYTLSTYGYTSPVVADFAPADGQEIVVTDVHGTVHVIGADGGLLWSVALGAFVWGQPAIQDFDGDGAGELVVALASGRLVSLNGDGTVRWDRPVVNETAVTWMTTGRSTAEAPPGIVIGTVGGTVALYDGSDGTRRWDIDLGAYSAVRAVADGDDDGTAEIYATARDGALRAIDATSGGIEWTTTLTEADVQMMPPPVAADLDGDAGMELVAASNDGRVAVVDPVDGSILSTYRRDVPIWTSPSLAELDGDGQPEVLVMYGDGHVAALDYRL